MARQTFALEILSILLKDGCGQGEGLPIGVIHRQFGLTRSKDDFVAGLEYAEEQNWLVDGNSTNMNFTDVGFAAAKSNLLI